MTSIVELLGQAVLKTVVSIAGKKIPATQNFLICFSIENLIANIALPLDSLLLRGRRVGAHDVAPVYDAVPASKNKVLH